jgi:hypothetical protein
MPVHRANAKVPISFTESGMITEVIPVRSRNALLPIFVTVLPPSVLGIVMAPGG